VQYVQFVPIVAAMISHMYGADNMKLRLQVCIFMFPLVLLSPLPAVLPGPAGGAPVVLPGQFVPPSSTRALL